MALIKAAAASVVAILVLNAHLRTSRKKGSHPEKTHGTRAGFGIDGPKARRGRESDKGRKIAASKQSKPFAAKVRLPKTGDEAANAVVQALKDAGDNRVKNDPTLQKRIKDNYKGIFGDSIEKADPAKRGDLERALGENQANPRYKKAADKFGQPAVVFKAFDPEEDLSSAAAYQRGPITVVIDPHKSYMDWSKDSPSKTVLGGPTVDESLPGLLRHEFGHHVENNLPDKDTSPFRDALPDGDTLKADLSFYAGSSWNDGNDAEPFAELVGVVTHPDYKHADLPDSIKSAAKLIEGYLYA